MTNLRYEFEDAKFVQASAYLTKNCNEMTKMKLFMLLFFADKKHMNWYGRPICGGHYVAMQRGPVLSEGYGLIKKQSFAAEQAGTDQLSASDIEALDECLDELGRHSEKDLSVLSPPRSCLGKS